MLDKRDAALMAVMATAATAAPQLGVPNLGISNAIAPSQVPQAVCAGATAIPTVTVTSGIPAGFTAVPSALIQRLPASLSSLLPNNGLPTGVPAVSGVLPNNGLPTGVPAVSGVLPSNANGIIPTGANVVPSGGLPVAGTGVPGPPVNVPSALPVGGSIVPGLPTNAVSGLVPIATLTGVTGVIPSLPQPSAGALPTNVIPGGNPLPSPPAAGSILPSISVAQPQLSSLPDVVLPGSTVPGKTVTLQGVTVPGLTIRPSAPAASVPAVGSGVVSAIAPGVSVISGVPLVGGSVLAPVLPTGVNPSNLGTLVPVPRPTVGVGSGLPAVGTGLPAVGTGLPAGPSLPVGTGLPVVDPTNIRPSNVASLVPIATFTNIGSGATSLANNVGTLIPGSGSLPTGVPVVGSGVPVSLPAGVPVPTGGLGSNPVATLVPVVNTNLPNPTAVLANPTGAAASVVASAAGGFKVNVVPVPAPAVNPTVPATAVASGLGSLATAANRINAVAQSIKSPADATAQFQNLLDAVQASSQGIANALTSGLPSSGTWSATQQQIVYQAWSVFYTAQQTFIKSLQAAAGSCRGAGLATPLQTAIRNAQAEFDAYATAVSTGCPLYAAQILAEKTANDNQFAAALQISAGGSVSASP